MYVVFIFRICPPGEFCTSSFSQKPSWHTFPTASLSRSLGVKVTVGSLPRQANVPHVRCWESHNETFPVTESSPPSMSCVQGAVVCLPTANVTSPKSNQARPKAPSPKFSHSLEAEERASSPRFQKPRVVMESRNQETARAVGRSRGPRHCLTAGEDPEKARRPNGLSLAGPPGHSEALGFKLARSPQGLLPHPQSSDLKHTGAIPKCLPSRKSPPESCYDRNRHTKSVPDLDMFGEPPASASQAPSPKVIVTKKSSPQAYYGKDRSNWFLQNVLGKDSGTDSDGSSPDIDRYLNKTLVNRLEPLSPQEMESYLAGLCTTKSKRDRGSLSPSPKHQSGLCVDLSKSGIYKETREARKAESATVTPFHDKDSKGDVDSQNGVSHAIDIFSGLNQLQQSFENGSCATLDKPTKIKSFVEGTSVSPTEISASLSAIDINSSTPQSLSDGADSQSSPGKREKDVEPVMFTLGTEEELTPQVLEAKKSDFFLKESPSAAVTSNKTTSLSTSPEVSEESLDGTCKQALPRVSRQRFTSLGSESEDELKYSTPKIHKSVSMPGGPVSGMSTVGLNKANSLLKSVMRKELGAQVRTTRQATTASLGTQG